MNRISRILAVGLVGAGLAAGAEAFAFGSGYGMGPGWGMGPGYGGGPGAGGGPGYWMGPGMMGAAWNFDPAWFDQAKKTIGIKPDQEKAWTQYVDAVRKNVQSIQAMHANMASDTFWKMSFDERQAYMLTQHNNRIEQATEVAQARDALFKELGADQQRAASGLLGPGGWAWGPGAR